MKKALIVLLFPLFLSACSIGLSPEEKVIGDVKDAQGRINLIKNPTDEHVFEILRIYGHNYVSKDDRYGPSKDNLYAKSVQSLKNPTEETLMKTIELSPYVIEYIKSPTEEMLLKAVKKDGKVVQWISKPSEEVMIAAIENEPEAIKFIPSAPEEIQLKAVLMEGGVIRGIKEPSEAVMIAAIDIDLEALEAIKNPTEKVLEEVELVKKVVAQPDYITTLEKPSQEELGHILTIDPLSIRYLDSPSEELQLLAISRNWTIGGEIKDLLPRARELYELKKQESSDSYDACLIDKLKQATGEHVYGEVIIRFVSNTRDSDQIDIIKGVYQGEKEGKRGFYVLMGVKNSPQVRCELEISPMIKYTSLNGIYHAL